jgi:RNA 2',3'-cyclic 3'-phosphodiesterase
MRLFTAIDLPENIEAHLADLIARLRPLSGAAHRANEKKLSWTRAGNLHVTTKFIGEWPEQRLEEMKRALRSVGSAGPIAITIRGIGWFPNARNPRVLWAGIQAGEPLQSLAHATEAAVHSIGVAKEDRDYAPHLTLARIRERVPSRESQCGSFDALRAAAAELESTEFGGFRAIAFYLYLSAGGRYTKLAEFRLT